MAAELILLTGVVVAALNPAERQVSFNRWRRLQIMELDATPLPDPDPELNALLARVDAID